MLPSSWKEEVKEAEETEVEMDLQALDDTHWVDISVSADGRVIDGEGAEVDWEVVRMTTLLLVERIDRMIAATKGGK